MVSFVEKGLLWYFFLEGGLFWYIFDVGGGGRVVKNVKEVGGRGKEKGLMGETLKSQSNQIPAMFSYHY